MSPVQNGTKVRYHGSLISMHGEATITGSQTDDIPRAYSAPSNDGYVYSLAFANGNTASQVRRQSFEVPDETCMRIQGHDARLVEMDGIPIPSPGDMPVMCGLSHSEAMALNLLASQLPAGPINPTEVI